MSILETTLIFVAIPVAIIVILGVFSVFTKPVPGTRPAAYKLGDKWDHDPMLWSAVDEVTTHGHHGGHHELVAGAPVDPIGGRASGKW
ncbi:aa3-type cytochrome oxidase subunit CtaJ [Rhodococcus aetherivorans]|uniref:aa3-type cytochrome oxidase subunit CtaJ n=1 Tax=Rhodococcus aetherivorans TaxID=191292 RepID=UPI00163AD0A5|nr:hypothetical protein [Rhodococcus aetherivorans]MBC2587078.1 hypothetical protein [Rhodococcus aetherivorans]